MAMQTMKTRRIGLAVAAMGLTLGVVPAALAQHSVAREWDEQLLDAIRLDRPRPPVHARNLYHTAACMWNAWAAYDTQADQVIVDVRATPPMGMTIAQARHKAISYAAYRMIKHRYQNAFGSATTLQRIRDKMVNLGYDPDFVGTAGDDPAAVGNRIFEQMRDGCINDGSNEPINYAAPGYMPVNQPLVLAFDGTTMNDPNRWQPLAFDYLVDQNGIVIGAATQSFVCPHWDSTTPFALRRLVPNNVYLDPGPPPLLGTATDAQYKAEFSQVIEFSSQLDPTDGVMIDISPAAEHNNPLGTNSGTGYPLNPATGQPYAPNIVKRADYARVLAEFWADGPDSETPPGHWNVVANDVTDTLTEKRIGGVGPVVDDLEWDVKMYLAINGAVHDAAVVAWGVKGKYDSVRPISAIRYMGLRGQSSNPALPSYDPQGLPLIPGLIELVTDETIQPGQRHEGIPERDPETNEILDSHVGDVVIRCWLTQPADPANEIGGVGWRLPAKWKPYQKNTFVTPPFAGYISGHSTFSRAGAEIMTAITGSPFFPGGLGTYSFPQNAYLAFEQGPSQALELQWATYYDAADEAGISRLYGGIHIQSDDLNGRVLGSRVGKTAWEQAKRYYQGRVSCPGDWNGSGGVSVQDIFDFVGDFFANNADMNLDGITSVQDIFDYLEAFFAGCP